MDFLCGFSSFSSLRITTLMAWVTLFINGNNLTWSLLTNGAGLKKLVLTVANHSLVSRLNMTTAWLSLEHYIEIFIWDCALDETLKNKKIKSSTSRCQITISLWTEAGRDVKQHDGIQKYDLRGYSKKNKNGIQFTLSRKSLWHSSGQLCDQLVHNPAARPLSLSYKAELLDIWRNDQEETNDNGYCPLSGWLQHHAFPKTENINTVLSFEIFFQLIVFVECISFYIFFLFLVT